MSEASATAAPQAGPGTLERLPRTTVFAYGLPGIGAGYMYLLIGLYVMKFSTDVLLISPLVMGLIFSASRIWDAVSDPLVGYLSDRTRSRFGRRRTWMAASVVPIAGVFLMIFAPPTGLEGTGLVIWMAVAIIGWYSVMTAFFVPHLSLGAELSTNYHERSRLFGYRHGVGPGDTIRLALGSGPVELAVAGIFYDYSGERELLIADRRALLAHLPDLRLSSAGVYLEPDADFEAARAALGRALAGRGVEVTPTRAIRMEAIRIFDRTFAITYALEAIALFVAILAMAEALLNLVYDRRSELALLRMHGASLGQVRRLVLIQAGLLGVLASLMGLALGAASSQVLLRVIHKQSFGWSLPLHWPWEFLAAVLGAIVVASVVAGLYPARVGARLVPVDVLRAE